MTSYNQIDNSRDYYKRLSEQYNDDYLLNTESD